MQGSFLSGSTGCRAFQAKVLWQMPSGEDDLLRIARRAASRGTRIAVTIGNVVVVAIALLIVTIGVLVTGPRLHGIRDNTTSWHIAKSSRMEAAGSDDLKPALSLESQSSRPFTTTELILHDSLLPPAAVFNPKAAGEVRTHGLRAPPTT